MWCYRPDPRGFTLLELLIVLVIIGVVLSLVSVRLEPSASQKLEQEGQRLALLLESARDESVARSETLAWSHDRNGYRFWRHDGQWHSLDDIEQLRPRRLPDELQVAEVTVNLQRQDENGKLLFQPSGVNELFRIVLTGAGSQVELSSDVLGRVTSGKPQANEPQ